MDRQKGRELMLRLYNTMTRRKEAFSPREPPAVRFFSCGPSVYLPPHLGNFRTFLFEDILERYLVSLGLRVERVLPFTDIEDKAIAQARKEGVSLPDLTARVAEEFYREACLLRIRPPTWNPRSSTTVEYAVDLIEQLLGKGIAYRHGPDIFFDPLKVPGFGKLARIDMARWPKKKRRFRKDTYPGVQWNYGDFILWHGAREGDTVVFETRLGPGRPAWNVQDPAMALPFLGTSLDIHAGGVDNLARHHDYNLAIVEGLTGREYSRFWLHGEHLLLDGKKMSKSRGNIVHLGDLLRDGCTPEEVRFFLIYGHYRDRMNMTRENLERAMALLAELRALAGQMAEAAEPAPFPLRRSPPAPRLEEVFRERMDDDLDVKGAIDGMLRSLRKLSDRCAQGDLSPGDARAALEELRRADAVIQVVFPREGP